MSKLVPIAMFHGKFHCIKTINVRKKNIAPMRPLTAEIRNIIMIKFQAAASSGIRKYFAWHIHRKKLVQSNSICEKRKIGNISEV